MLLYPPRESSSSSSSPSSSSSSPPTTNTTEKRQRVALSFNGGKDCTVVLHLLLAAIAESSATTTATAAAAAAGAAAGAAIAESSATTAAATATAEQKQDQRDGGSSGSSGSSSAPLPTTTPAASSKHLIDFVLPFYFATEDVFTEEIDFVRRTSEKYFQGNENLLTLRNVTNQEGVSALVEQYGVKAFLMGTRSTDPDGRWLNGVFWPSSKGWTPFMRINPCLDWSYQDVWIFLRFFDVDYCELYNQGYTSIGTKSTSNPNPLLRKGSTADVASLTEIEEEEEEEMMYHPAYMLADGSQERAGRVAKQKVAKV